MTNKVIVIDWGVAIHKAIFAWPNNPSIPPTYTCLNMMLGWLYRLAIDPDDLIIVAVDGRNSWRKDFETEYKGNRAEKRKASGIDFDKWYGEFDILHSRLNDGLDWHFIKIDRLEADDIMAVACRYYADREVILVTHDADLEQCWEYPNVKIFSPSSKKWKVKPKNFDLNTFHASKIKKETTDNMISPILNEQDYERRKLCIDLITLPDWVEKSIRDQLDKIGSKHCHIAAIPFKSLQEKFSQLYNDTSKILRYEDQIAKEVAEEERKKKKKLTEKEKLEKATLRIEQKYQKEQAKLLSRIEKLENTKKVKKEKLNDYISKSIRTEANASNKN